MIWGKSSHHLGLLASLLNGAFSVRGDFCLAELLEQGDRLPLDAAAELPARPGTEEFHEVLLAPWTPHVQRAVLEYI